MASNIISAVIGSKASKKAANQQAAAANQATKELARQYDQTREDYLPFLTTGTASNAELSRLLGVSGDETSEGYGSLAKPFTMQDFEADPGYAFRLSEGMKALDRANAAKGKYFSGQAIKGLMDYGQEAASQEYSNAYDRYTNNQTNLYNRLAGLSNTGQTTATGLASAGENYANNAAENIIGAGNARAAGTVGSANAWTTGLQNMKNQAMFAAMASDIRLKENIKKVGNSKGFNIYEFSYINKPERWRGVMAQEVAKTRPDAIRAIDGFLYVDYDRIGLAMEAVCP